MADHLTLSAEQRQAVLERTKSKLCPDGADTNVASKVLEHVGPWYLFPETQLRPRVVGLWGMTGTGKTHLVKQIVAELGLEERTLWLDGGRLASRSIEPKFDNMTNNFNGQPYVLVIDEFQHTRSKENGAVLDRGAMRAVWELIDGGQVSTSEGSRHLDELLEIREVIKDALDRGLKVSKGRVRSGFKMLKAFNTAPFAPDSLLDQTQPWVLPEGEWHWLRQAIQRPTPGLRGFRKILEGVHTKNILAFMDQLILNCSMPRPFHGQQGLIIVLGNLDDLYALGEDATPELDPDVLLAQHAQIGLTGLQESLQQLFRIEQVARLGTEHFAVPPFSRADLLQVAGTHVAGLCAQLSRSTEMEITVHPDLLERIVRDNTIAVLGARPVLHALDRIIPNLVLRARQEAVVAKLAVRSLVLEIHGAEVRLCMKGGKTILQKDVPLRSGDPEGPRPVVPEVAVHEAGHAVVGIALAGKRPLQVCARTSSRSTHGFVVWERPQEHTAFTRRMAIPRLAMTLGGWAAETLHFGEDGLSAGCGSDIAQATGMALSLLSAQGMSGLPILTAQHPTHDGRGIHSLSLDRDAMVAQWIKEAADQATAVLKQERKLLDAVAKALMERGTLNAEEVGELVLAYGSPSLRKNASGAMRLAS